MEGAGSFEYKGVTCTVLFNCGFVGEDGGVEVFGCFFVAVPCEESRLAHAPRGFFWMTWPFVFFSAESYNGSRDENQYETAKGAALGNATVEGEEI